MIEFIDTLIIGAGIAGCSLARALSLQGRTSIVLDPHQGVPRRFAGEFIHPRGAAVLDELGLSVPLLDPSRGGGVSVAGFAVYPAPRFDGSSPAPHGSEDEAPVRLDYTELPRGRRAGIAVDHVALLRTLHEAFPAGAQLRRGWRFEDVEAVHEGFIRVLVRDGSGAPRRLDCRTLVGADGKASVVRRRAGLGDRRRRLGYTAGLAVDADLADSQLPARHASVLLGPPGPILIYPIAQRDGGLRYRLSFDLPRELPARGHALKDHLERAYLPYLPAPLHEAGLSALRRHNGTLPMAPTFDLEAPRAAKGRVFLIGDAAGCAHPITASGMTMALLDAQALSLAMAKHPELSDPRSSARVGADYLAAHRPYVLTRQTLADAIYETLCGHTEGARALQDALFSYWRSSAERRVRSLGLLACEEQRPRVFVEEYLRAAGTALQSSLSPAQSRPIGARLRRAGAAGRLALDRLGEVSRLARVHLGR